MKFLIVLSVLFLGACSASLCRSYQSRCSDNIVQICDSRGQWQTVMDCSSVVHGDWECGVDDGEHTCVRCDNR